MSEQCDREIYEKGEVALICALGSKRMEPWVVKVREISGQRVDWHYVGGRAVMKFIGDPAAVQRAIVEATPRLIELHREELAAYRESLRTRRQIAQNCLGPDIYDDPSAGDAQ